MELDPFFSQTHHLLKANSQQKLKNRAGKRKGTKENGTTKANHDHHGRGCHHGQIVVASGLPAEVCPLHCVLVYFFGSQVFALNHPSWAYWTSFATTLNLVGLNFSPFS